MTTSIEDLKTTMASMAKQLEGVQDMAKQLQGFQQVMTTTLDKLNDLESWRTIAETSMGSMIQQSKETSSWVLQLEARPPPPPCERGPPLQPPSSLPLPPTTTLIHPLPPSSGPLPQPPTTALIRPPPPSSLPCRRIR